MYCSSCAEKSATLSAPDPKLSAIPRDLAIRPYTAQLQDHELRCFAFLTAAGLYAFRTRCSRRQPLVGLHTITRFHSPGLQSYPLPAACSSACGRHVSSLQHVNKAVERRQLGDLKGALRELELAIECDPDSAAVYNARGMVKQSLDDIEGAMADFDQALHFDPKYAAAYNSRGKIKQDRGDVEEAMVDFELAIKFDPNCAVAYFNRAELKRTASKPNVPGALKDYELAIAANPRYAVALSRRGSIKLMRQDMDGAFADFEMALKSDSKCALAYNNRGRVLHHRGLYTEALQDFDSAITEDPYYVKAFYYRGETKACIGKLASATADFTKAISLDPEFARAYHGRGSVHHRLGEVQKAFDEYGLAIKCDSKFASAYNSRAILKRQQGDLRGALADHDFAVRWNPKLSVAYNSRGLVKQLQTDLKGALEDYSAAIQIDPNYTIAFSNRGQVKADMGDFDGALEDYNTVLEQNPKYALGYSNRGRISQRRHDYEAAMKDYQAAIDSDSTCAIAYSNRGELKKRIGDLGGALVDFETALQHNANCAIAYSNRGTLHYDRGRLSPHESLDSDRNKDRQQFSQKAHYGPHHELATVDFAKAIECDPRCAHAYAARGHLKQLSGRLTAALSDLSFAVKFDPVSAGAFEKRAQVNCELYNLDAAIEDAELAVKWHPESATALNTRGLIKQKLGDAEGALADFMSAIERDSKLTCARSNCGTALWNKQEESEALDQFNIAIESEPRGPHRNAYLVDRCLLYAGLGRLEMAVADMRSVVPPKVWLSRSLSVAAGGWFSGDDIPDEQYRNFGMTPFRRIWQKQKHTPGLMVEDVMVEAEKLVKLSCRDESSAEDLCCRLKAEIAQENPLTSKHVAEILWTSCQVDADGKPFNSFLQAAMRYNLTTLSEDAAKAHLAARIAICLNLPPEDDNSLKLHDNQPHQSFDAISAVEDSYNHGGLWYQNIRKQKGPRGMQYPVGRKCYRGSSLPENYNGFFEEAKGRQVCIPNFFATSVDKSHADCYLANAASQGKDPVLWEVSFDARGDPLGANDADFLHKDVRYVHHRAPDAPAEREFLFVPYAAFTVVEITWQEHPTPSQPHVICLEACDIGEEMLDDMPVAPWS